MFIKNNVGVYNGNASIINFPSIGTCATCAMEIEEEVSQGKKFEKKLNFLRLPILLIIRKSYPFK
ncbi:MAG: hypothetical protein O4751_12510 [Trichodesmium sp. St2_bin6]|nr:hypothetical protein [Trichodesmium sp. St5_bin8]MDE5079043.1 hypothetical protein [Trichodesmium sp. St2_bin6]